MMETSFKFTFSNLDQGFNTGVVLYRFDRMRKNEIYNSYLNSIKVKELVDK
jgi:hypothetical protein